MEYSGRSREYSVELVTSLGAFINQQVGYTYACLKQKIHASLYNRKDLLQISHSSFATKEGKEREHVKSPSEPMFFQEFERICHKILCRIMEKD